MRQNIFKNNNRISKKKREWGTEKSTTPLSIAHSIPSTLKTALSRIGIVLTIFFWLAYINSTIIRQFIEGPQSYHFTMEAYGYSVVVSVLTFSALMYLVARLGAFQVFTKHSRVPRSILEKYFGQNKHKVTVLVPSYNEEPEVIRKTLFSAALQEYPDKRIVLLIDDNPFPGSKDVLTRLNKTRAIGKEIEHLFNIPHKRFKLATKKFEYRNVKTKLVSSTELRKIAKEYRWASSYLEKIVDKEVVEDHVDQFFVDQVINGLRKDLILVAEAVDLSVKEGAKLPYERVHNMYERLLHIFKCEFAVFERKRYISVSQEANKAMNLNAYIGLMGGNYKEEQTADGTILTRVNRPSTRTLSIPDSEFILTLDADSILLREYCMRLIYFLSQKDNEKVAVTQTPYSSFRGTHSRIERISGATTDIQHILHQGMSFHGAAFWVGANAVIRKKALEDIMEKEWIGGVEVKRYIQDRTVIEDTESSIDLAVHGWKIVNYPERLSYSATPPDFGSLIIQRRRWANGGLLILPKLLHQIGRKKAAGIHVANSEIFLRVNYMASIAWSTFGLMFLLAYPYDGRLLSPLVLFAALPYFIAMAHDLKYCGYSYADIFRIYGFNLILLPVNFAGVIKSIEQALTGKKIPFARTPKIKDRTAVPIIYLVLPLLIIAFSVFTFERNIVSANWGNAIFALFNAITATWAIVAYIGVGNLVHDIGRGIIDMLYVEEKKKSHQSTNNPARIDWQAVLYHGDINGKLPQGSI